MNTTRKWRNNGWRAGLRIAFLGGAMAGLAWGGWLLPSACAQIVYAENFESPGWTIGDQLLPTPKNGWTGNDNSGSTAGSIIWTRIAASPGTPSSGTQSLRLYDNSSTGSATAVRDLGSNTSQGYVELDVYKINNTGLYLRFYDTGTTDTGGSVYNFQLAISANITIYAGGSTSSTQIDQVATSSYYTSGTWAKFRINFDESTNTYEVLVNGVTALSGTYAGANWQVGRLVFTSGTSSATNGDSYVDNLVLASVPEPSAFSLIVLGGGMLGCCWKRFRHGFRPGS